MTAPMRVRLDVLGPMRVTPEVSGPRRLAVLVYLALARPRGPHSRDTLAALLWPESDEASARHGLRNALHALRQAIGDEVVVSTGENLVGVVPEHIECDALALESDLAAGRFDDALNRYHGDLLQGFFVSEAPEFEQWLDQERRRLKVLLLSACERRIEVLRAARQLDAVVVVARKACEVAPDDEPSLRRLVQALAEAGDRVGAVRAYEAFAARVLREFDATPSAETMALMRDLRVRPELASPVVTESAGVGTVTRPWRASRSRLWYVAGAVSALALLAFLIPRKRASDSGPVVAWVALTNDTGDPSFDYIADGIPDRVAHRLFGIGGISLGSATMAGHRAVRLAGTLARVSDSLQVRMQLIDGTPFALRPRTFLPRDLQDVESRLASDIAGRLFAVSQPAQPHATRVVEPKSYDLTMRGWHQLLALKQPEAARDLFAEAVAIDPQNSRALAGLSSAWAALTHSESVDLRYGLEMSESYARRSLDDSAQGTAWVNLAFVQMVRDRKLDSAEKLIRRAKAVDPSNPEVFLVSSVIYRHAWKWNESRDDIRIAQRLDPVTGPYFDREALVEICSNDLEAARKIYAERLSQDPGDRGARAGLVRVHALAGRFGEALDVWRDLVDSAKNPALRAQIAKASRDSAGYWQVKQAAVRAKPPANHMASPTRHAQYLFGVGDYAGGYAKLDSLVSQDDFTMHRLPCNEYFDEVRHSARFTRIVERVGPLR